MLFSNIKSKISANKQAIQVILLITLLSSLPLFYEGINDNSHDMAFHINRIEAIVSDIKVGLFPSRLQWCWNNGYGYPMSIYYGDLLLYFPVFLRILGLDITYAFKVFVFGVNLVTALFCHITFSKIFKSNKISYVLTFAFCLMPYRLMDMYVRGAVGEYSAIIFFPLIALSVYNIYSDEINNTWSKMKNALILAFAMSGIVTSHILSTEMTVLFLLIFFLFMWKKSLSPNVLATYLLAILFSVLACTYFIVPFLDYFLNVEIFSSANLEQGMRIQRHGVSIADFFAFFKTPFGSSPLMQYTPGATLLLALFLAIYLWSRKRASKALKILTVFSLFAMFLCTNVFPWNLFTKNKFLKIFTQIQFPWRFLGIAGLLLTLLLGYVMVELNNDEILHYFSLNKVVKLGIILSLVATFVFLSEYADNANRNKYTEANDFHPYAPLEYLRAQKVDGEYITSDTSKYDGKIHGDYESVDIIKNEGLNLAFYVKNKSSDTEVILPRTNYPGYHITDENGHEYNIYDSDNMLIAFSLPAGYDGNIYLVFTTPWYWTLALWISVLSTVFMIALWIKVSRNK